MPSARSSWKGHLQRIRQAEYGWQFPEACVYNLHETDSAPHMGITAARLQLVFAGKILVYIIQQEF